MKRPPAHVAQRAAQPDSREEDEDESEGSDDESTSKVYTVDHYVAVRRTGRTHDVKVR